MILNTMSKWNELFYEEGKMFYKKLGIQFYNYISNINANALSS